MGQILWRKLPDQFTLENVVNKYWKDPLLALHELLLFLFSPQHCSKELLSLHSRCLRLRQLDQEDDPSRITLSYLVFRTIVSFNDDILILLLQENRQWSFFFFFIFIFLPLLLHTSC